MITVVSDKEVRPILTALSESDKCIKDICAAFPEVPRSNVRYYIERMKFIGLVEYRYFKKQTIVGLTALGREYLGDDMDVIIIKKE